MHSHESTELAPERPRYPLVAAVAWIAFFAAVDWAAGGTWRAEPAYLPVVAVAAWYYGRRKGLWVALLATAAAAITDLAFLSEPGAAGVTWLLIATACTYAVPAWLAAELGNSHRRLALVMTTDPDSGLLNRSGLLARLGDELLRTERFGGDLSVLCIGLDGVAGLEEEKGPQHADRLLFGFSETLRTVARRTDTVARIGDDEFAVLLPGTGTATAQVVAERHQRLLGEWLASREPKLSCSVGHTTSPLGRKLGAPALLALAVAHMQGQRPAPPRTAGPAVPSGTAAERSLAPG